MSELERYLDDLFDRLAGTGAAGRRALAEAEDHLRAVRGEAIARGLPAGEAEHEAVIRFGSARLVARQLRAARRDRLNRALSSAWLLAGAAIAVLGGCYLAAAARLAVLGAQHPDCRFYLSQSCLVVMPLAARALVTGAIVLGVGLVLILIRMLVVRAGGLAALGRGISRRWLASLGAIAVVAAAVFAFTGAGVDHGVGVAPEPWQVADPLVRLLDVRVPLVAGCVAAAALLGGTAVSLIRSRRGQLHGG